MALTTLVLCTLSFFQPLTNQSPSVWRPPDGQSAPSSLPGNSPPPPRRVIQTASSGRTPHDLTTTTTTTTTTTKLTPTTSLSPPPRVAHPPGYRHTDAFVACCAVELVCVGIMCVDLCLFVVSRGAAASFGSPGFLANFWVTGAHTRRNTHADITHIRKHTHTHHADPGLLLADALMEVFLATPFVHVFRVLRAVRRPHSHARITHMDTGIHGYMDTRPRAQVKFVFVSHQTSRTARAILKAHTPTHTHAHSLCTAGANAACTSPSRYHRDKRRC